MLSKTKLENATDQTHLHAQAGMIAEPMAVILERLGEDPKRQGLLKTPMRVEKSLQFLTSGYQAEPHDILKGALFSSEDLGYEQSESLHDRVVLVRDMEFYSLCEHHMLPFYGRAHIAYIPKAYNVGLSKLPRLLEAFSRRLQVQERLTNQICKVLTEVLQPHGVAVALEASHLCMMMRGVQSQGSLTLTTASSGVYREQAEFRQAFLNQIQK